MDGISLIICCYNSALRLPLALECLAKQKTNTELNWEIIIVNNNSTDNTVETAKQVWDAAQDGNNLRLVNEYKTGLCFARQAGVKAALYDIIIFCDDDNLLSETYLQQAYELVHATKKKGYGIWGGKLEAYFDVNTTVPEWFEKEKANYVVGEQADTTGDISGRGYVWGAGMIILKDLFLKVTGSDIPLLLVGRKENILLAGDDSEICMRSLILGYKLYYDEHLIVKHYIPQHKLTSSYNEGLKKGFSASGAILNKYTIFIYYVLRKNALALFYYKGIYKLKYFLNNLRLRKLTAHDTLALHALLPGKKFYDPDFDKMHELLQLRTKV